MNDEVITQSLQGAAHYSLNMMDKTVHEREVCISYFKKLKQNK